MKFKNRGDSDLWALVVLAGIVLGFWIILMSIGTNANIE